MLWEQKCFNETFNITFGNSRKINELAEVLKSEFKDVKIDYKNKEKFVPERGTLNNDKAKTILGFNPKYSIEEGYIKYISWYKNFWKNINKNKYDYCWNWKQSWGIF